MAVSKNKFSTVLSLCALLGWVSAGSAGAATQFSDPIGEASRAGMHGGRWTSGNKQIFGTSYEAYDNEIRYSGKSPTAPISRVWFTGARGILTEVYWPTIDTAQTKDIQFLVTDGHSFFVEERKDCDSRVEWLEEGVPAFRVINKDRKGRFEIERVIFTDPDTDVVYQRVTLVQRVPGLRFFLLHKPMAGNTPMGDHARVSKGKGNGPGAGLFAWQGRQAQAMVFSIPLKQVTAGFVGTSSDGWQDLSKDFHLDSHFETARDGNVVMTAWLDVPEAVGTHYLDMALGFGPDVDSAYRMASQSLEQNLSTRLKKYTQQWQGYLSSVRDLSDVAYDGGKLYRASVAIMKSMEDKTYEGAFVASPTIPWGEHNGDNFGTPIENRHLDYNMTCGYHCVWPRDLYQMATAMLAIDDPKSAVASLKYLKRIQYSANDGIWEFSFRTRSKDGSFPQNTWVNGDAHWSSLQVDEVAMPVILAYRLWKGGHIQWADYWDMVRRAADFIQEFGPWSRQERWEEAFGASPSNIAAEITALWTAAEFAEQVGDSERVRKYRATADAWNSKPGDNLDTWTFTTSGPHGNGKYYLRVVGAGFFDQVWNPNDESEFDIANGGGRAKQKEITDGGFLELVRFGVRGALNRNILETIPEYDQTIRFDVPGIGPGFHRYYRDRYNRDDFTGQETPGMLWPLLTGERGHYELAAAIESGKRANEIDGSVLPYIRAMEGFATPSSMLPEQVWKEGPGAGQSTGSATPLGWAHGEYVKLLRSKAEHTVFDMIPSVIHRRQVLLTH